jgi:hypothetical protein
VSAFSLQTSAHPVDHGRQATVRSSRRAVPLAGFALLNLSLIASSVSVAAAQSATTRKDADKSMQAPEPTDTVIISKMPERKGPIYALLKKLFCKNNGAVTGISDSEDRPRRLQGAHLHD